MRNGNRLRTERTSEIRGIWKEHGGAWVSALITHWNAGSSGKRRQDAGRADAVAKSVRTWGAAVLRPYEETAARSGVGDEGDPDVFAFVDEGNGDAFGGLGSVHGVVFARDNGGNGKHA